MAKAKYWLLGAGALVVAGGAGFAVIAWEQAIEPVTVAPGDFAPELVARGEQLSAVGNCAVCHTSDDGVPYAGGYAVETPFGAIHGTNITPDRETGIGTWSEAAFVRAMREGVNREGQHLYPAFPYHFFVRTRDEDLSAIYAYLMTREAAPAEPAENDLPFPFDFRPLLAGWKLLFHREGVWQDDPSRPANLNTGAYLTEGLGHCGACHMPVNSLGAPRRAEGLSGGEIDTWLAPALDASNPSPQSWGTAALTAYLRDGRHPDHGAAAGPMRPVVKSLAGAADSDVADIAAYVATLSPVPAPISAQTQTAAPRSYSVRREGLMVPATTTDPMGSVPPTGRGDVLFAGLCASCHYPTAPDVLDWPHLPMATALHLDSPNNLVHVILDGIGDETDPPDHFMPGFAMADADLAALVGYLREDIAGAEPWPDLPDTISDLREDRQETAE